MRRRSMWVGLCLVGLLCALEVQVQEPVWEGERWGEEPVVEDTKRPQPRASDPESPARVEEPGVSVPLGSVPRLLKFGGTLTDPLGQPQTGLVGVTFALYEEQEGGAPVWLETQNVELDPEGRYTVLLGAEQTEGFPLDALATGEARWLGVQVQGQEEQPRILLVSVPYALKAEEAETLAGKAASDFVLSEDLEKTVTEQVETTAKEVVAQETEEQITTKAIDSGASTFTDSNSTQVVNVTQNGSGIGLRATAASSSAIIGVTNATSGGKAGLRGVTSEPSGVGIFGIANSTTGVNSGVRGEASGDTGRGLVGRALSPTGNTIGLRGVAFSPNGTGISALVDATTGSPVGLEAEVRSAGGTAAIFRNTNDGKLLSGVSSTGEVFSVNGSGDMTTGKIEASTSEAVGFTTAVLGQTASTGGVGIMGDATASSGAAIGVHGVTASTDPGASAVFGLATANTGGAGGVRGETFGDTGIAVYGLARDAGGFTTGVRGDVFSPVGTAGLFVNHVGGKILSGRNGLTGSPPGTEVFSVAGDGTVTATGFVGDGSGLTNVTATGGDADTLDGLDSTAFARLAAANTFSGTQTMPLLVVTNFMTAGRGSFSSNSGSTVLTVDETSGSAMGLKVTGGFIALDSQTATGDIAVRAVTQKTTGNPVAVRADASAAASGTGVLAFGGDSALGVIGEGKTGLLGQSNVSEGVGVQGRVFTSTTATIGVEGYVASTAGTGVVGEATAASGSTVGVSGTVTSSDGIAGRFEAPLNGRILGGFNGSVERFRVEGDGDVVLSSGDLAIVLAGRGLILKTADGTQCARIFLNNAVNGFVFQTVTCP